MNGLVLLDLDMSGEEVAFSVTAAISRLDVSGGTYIAFRQANRLEGSHHENHAH